MPRTSPHKNKHACRHGHVYEEGSFSWSVQKWFKKSTQEWLTYKTRVCRVCARINQRRSYDKLGKHPGIHNSAKTHCVNGHDLRGNNCRVSKVWNKRRQKYYIFRRCKRCEYNAKRRWCLKNRDKVNAANRERRAKKRIVPTHKERMVNITKDLAKKVTRANYKKG